jgi:hypothetical protein
MVFVPGDRGRPLGMSMRSGNEQAILHRRRTVLPLQAARRMGGSDWAQAI